MVDNQVYILYKQTRESAPGWIFLFAKNMNIFKLKKHFLSLYRPINKEKVLEKDNQEIETHSEKYLNHWVGFSKPHDEVYPSQGLLFTSFDGLDITGFKNLSKEKVLEILKVRNYFLTLSNHPLRIHYQQQVSQSSFVPPPAINCKTMENAISTGISLSIRDLGSRVRGSSNGRISRTDRYSQGIFVKLGKQARIPFVGSANPDVWGSAQAIATMAASHALVGIPRNGLFSDIKRQSDLAKETLLLLDFFASTVLKNRPDSKLIRKIWGNNLMGILEPNPEKAVRRAESLMKIGIKSFRIYSPEPGNGPIDSVVRLRSEFGKSIEIITGQIVDVDQAKRAEEAGADCIYVGIGGGGRCTTGVRSGTVIDWPELVWQLRGKLNIPILVEGGGSDHIAVTLMLGVSGIGVSRVASGGTIESPGGYLYCVDREGKLFKPYGGEASARNKILEGKCLPFDIPLFVEGETSKAFIDFMNNGNFLPTITYNLHQLLEEAILALVFRGVENIAELQQIDPSPLCQITPLGRDQIFTH